MSEISIPIRYYKDFPGGYDYGYEDYDSDYEYDYDEYENVYSEQDHRSDEISEEVTSDESLPGVVENGEAAVETATPEAADQADTYEDYSYDNGYSDDVLNEEYNPYGVEPADEVGSEVDVNPSHTLEDPGYDSQRAYEQGCGEGRFGFVPCEDDLSTESASDNVRWENAIPRGLMLQTAESLDFVATSLRGMYDLLTEIAGRNVANLKNDTPLR